MTKIGFYCGMGHKVEVTKEICDIPIEYRPTEACEKPKTNKEYVRLSLERSRKCCT